MKNKVYKLVVMLLVASTLTACGDRVQEESGVVISAGNTNKDTSQNAQISANDAPSTQSSSSSTDTTTDNNNTENVVSESMAIKIPGYWYDQNDNVYYFDTNTFSIHYKDESGETTSTITGTYESDFKTHITLKYSEQEERNYTKEETEVIDTYNEMLEDKTSYAWLMANSSSYEILNSEQLEAKQAQAEENGEDQTGVTITQIEFEQFVLIAYDENGNEIGRALYDPSSDVNSLDSEVLTDDEVTEEPTPKAVKEHTLEYSLAKATVNGAEAIQLKSNSEEIILIRQ